MLSGIRLDECLWIRSQNGDDQPVFRPMMRSLQKRQAKIIKLDVSSPAEMQRLRDQVWKTDQHVILQGLLPRELNAIRPIFAGRKNFSIMPIDWWVVPFWFSRHATFNIFHNYSGIMVHTQGAQFMNGDFPPWLYLPQRKVAYEIQSALLRPIALLTAPLLDVYKRWQRSTVSPDPKSFLYFPFPIAEEEVPLHSESPRYDFTSLGAVMGTWLMRDPYVTASLNFANLYSDRLRLINIIGKLEGQPFTIYDRRKHKAFVPWEELTRIIRQSRFVICTGGLQHNSVPKFLEYACLGIPMFGTALPYEYPWLERCLVQVNPMRISATALKSKMLEALEQHAVLRQNCLAMRETLLRMYNPDTLLDLLQDQMRGRPVPAGYLRQPALQPTPADRLN